MAGRGGYRAPSKPAAVSGPGSMSRRTDGGQPRMGLPNAAYGEQQDFQQIQAGAEMAQAQQREMPRITPLNAPTERPDEPVTAGAPSGPGVGPEAIGLGMTNRDQSKIDAREIAKYLPALEKLANSEGVPTGFVRFVKYIRETGR